MENQTQMVISGVTEESYRKNKYKKMNPLR